MSTTCIYSQNRINFLDNTISFIKPSDVLMQREMPRFSNRKERSEFIAGGKFILDIIIKNEETFREEARLPEKIVPLLKKDNISQSDYLALLDPSTVYNLSGMFSSANIKESYSLFKYKNKNVGETYAFADIEGSFYPVEYGFVLTVVVDTSIVTIRFKLLDDSNDLPKQLIEYFYYDESYKTYRWKPDVLKTREKFYKQLVSGNNGNMPLKLRLLVEKWNAILESLQITCY